jgi:hypothetical protein
MLADQAADEAEVMRQIQSLRHGLARLRHQTRQWDKRDRRREDKHQRRR